jgi:hypothetical protein
LQLLAECPQRGYATKHFGHFSWRLYPDRRGLDSFPMTDDGGVLGNLPNSRPGRRSSKRAATPESAKPGPEPEPPAAPPRPDPVGDAVRAVTGIAGTGARLAADIGREVARRLPRP